MSPPQTYAEWLPLLDRFRAGDDTVLDAMKAGTIEWTNVVAERWTRQVSDALIARLQAISKQLQTGLDRARGDYLAISNSLLMARRTLLPLSEFVKMPAIPTDIRRHLESELNRWASETQKSLESTAESVRNDQGRLLKTMRDHALTAVTAALAPPPASQISAGENPRCRRVIL
jgi:hypothetical protein